MRKTLYESSTCTSISECPVADCMVCDTDVSKCDMCSRENAVFDDTVSQCVIQDPTGKLQYNYILH